jgi:putative PIN family toxin of toxin-antitoxin system
MIRVVLDTNIIVSAAINRHGNQAALIELVAANQITPCASPAILAEYHGVLSRPALRLDAACVTHLSALLAAATTMLAPTARLSVCSDESDNRFLECAEAAEAKFLVTGNKRHFPKRWRATRIVNARELIGLITPRGSQ